MTQADSALALRRSLDSTPTHGPGQAHITAKTPLPDGWASFCSKPDINNRAHWYATAPYDVDEIQKACGRAAWGLHHTVTAENWVGLHKAVAEQMELYERLTQESE